MYNRRLKKNPNADKYHGASKTGNKYLIYHQNEGFQPYTTLVHGADNASDAHDAWSEHPDRQRRGEGDSNDEDVAIHQVHDVKSLPYPPDKHITASKTAAETTCSNCGKTMDELEAFPGHICLDCHAKTPEGRRMPTADELTRMWGGPVRRNSAYNPFSDPQSAYNNPNKGPHKGTPDDLFPDGVPLHGDLSPEQQAWLDKRSSFQVPCDDCGTPIADTPFASKCASCKTAEEFENSDYQNIMAPHCTTCGKPIQWNKKTDEVVQHDHGSPTV
jgi:hypothetical protein